MLDVIRCWRAGAHRLTEKQIEKLERIKPKGKQSSKLSPEDLLIFYAGLEYKDGEEKGKARLFVIGYFAVEKIYDFKRIPKEKWEQVFKELKNNAHSKIYFRLKELGIDYSDDDLVIVKRDEENSKLFPKARPVGDNNDNMRKDLVQIFGYKGSLKRAVGHHIDEQHIHKVKKWLESEGTDNS